MPLLLNLLPARFLLTPREWFDYKISHCVITFLAYYKNLCNNQKILSTSCHWSKFQNVGYLCSAVVPFMPLRGQLLWGQYKVCLNTIWKEVSWWIRARLSDLSLTCFSPLSSSHVQNIVTSWRVCICIKDFCNLASQETKTCQDICWNLI